MANKHHLRGYKTGQLLSNVKSKFCTVKRGTYIQYLDPRNGGR